MASRAAAFFLLFITFIATTTTTATTVFKVGDELGWKEPEAGNPNMYDIWATSKRFQVGDSLTFVYENDSVIEVEKWGYYHCNASEPIVAFNNGNSVFKLEKPGAFYYISGKPEHCRSGQRLLIEVMGYHHHRAAPPQYIAPQPDYPSRGPSPQPSSGGQVPAIPLSTTAILFIVLLGSFYV